MRYVVTVNRPGYLPEVEPEEFSDWANARAACVEEACLTAGGDTALHAHLERQANEVREGELFTLNVGGFAHNVERAQ